MTGQRGSLYAASEKLMEFLAAPPKSHSIAAIGRMADEVRQSFAATDYPIAKSDDLDVVVKAGTIRLHIASAEQKLAELNEFSYSAKTLEFLRNDIRGHYTAAAEIRATSTQLQNNYPDTSVTEGSELDQRIKTAGTVKETAADRPSARAIRRKSRRSPPQLAGSGS